MSTLAIEIGSRSLENIQFPSVQYFVIRPVDPANENLIGRQVCTTMSELKKTRELRSHKESGSRREWKGGDNVKCEPITVTRGIGMKFPDPGTQPDLNNTAMYAEWLEWFESGYKMDLYFEYFEDTEYNNADGTPVDREPIMVWKAEGAKPSSYTGPKGDAKSSDTQMEELIFEVEDIRLVSNRTAWTSAPVGSPSSI